MRPRSDRVRRHRQALATRRAYLDDQIAHRTASGEPCDFAKAERGAIAYHQAVLEDVEAIGLLGRMGFLTVAERQLLRHVVEMLEDRLATA